MSIKISALILLLFPALLTISQNLKMEFHIKSSSDMVLLKKMESGGRWIKTEIYIAKGGTEEFVGEFQGYADEIISIFYGKKYSGMQNYKLSIIYKKNSSGLHFFSADRLLDNPNTYFPYKLENGHWIKTTVAQRGFAEINSSNNHQTQVDDVIWYNAKLFTIKYKTPRNGNGIEPKTFAEIDGTVTWLKPDSNEFVSENNNMIIFKN